MGDFSSNKHLEVRVLNVSVFPKYLDLYSLNTLCSYPMMLSACVSTITDTQAFTEENKSLMEKVNQLEEGRRRIQRIRRSSVIKKQVEGEQDSKRRGRQHN